NARLSRRRARFPAIALESSPTCAAMLKVSNGGALTPPARRVKAARMPAGEGQSGTMKSGLLVVIERLQQPLQVIRERCFPFERTAGHGMGQSEPRGMQRLA